MNKTLSAGILLVVSLSVRMLVMWPIFQNPSVAVEPDSTEYLQLAKNLITHGHFSEQVEPPFIPETFRTPGYPLFLAAFMSLTSAPIVPAACAQVLLSVLAIFLAWRWFLKLGSPNAAFYGALVLALDPVTVLHTPLLLSDTLLFVLLIPAAFLTWKAMEKSSLRSSITAGIFWSVSAIVRPVSLYLPLLLVWLPKSKKAKILFLLVAYSIPCFWIYRNTTQAGLSAMSSMSGIHLLRCFASGAQALSRDQADLHSDLETEVLAEHPQGFTSDVEQSRIYAAKAMPIIKAHPWRVLEYCYWGTVKTLGGTAMDMIVDALYPGQSRQLTGVTGTPKAKGLKTLALMKFYPALFPIFAFYLVGLGILYLGHLAGVWLLFRSGKVAQAIYLFIVPVYFLLISNHAGYYRHRIPMMPFLTAGLVIALTKIGREKGNGKAA